MKLIPDSQIHEIMKLRYTVKYKYKEEERGEQESKSISETCESDFRYNMSKANYT